MFYRCYSSGIAGIDGYVVTVESDITKQVPDFNLVGLPDAAIKESKERIYSAVANSGLKFPKKKIIINLSPSDIKKEGAHYDLPIALSLLCSEYHFLPERFERTIFAGELSLGGELRKIKGCIPIIISARENNDFDSVLIPKGNGKEAQVVDGIHVFTAENLRQVVEYLTGEINLKESEKLQSKRKGHKTRVDFNEVKGNLIARRAAEISASGYHNMMMVGPPGSGKSMIAKRINTIMDRLDNEEYIQVSKIYSSIGKFNQSLVERIRPYRAPHHTATMTSIIGGGSHSSPGEVVMAHKGVLFLDEMLEFDKKTLEVLRQPIEDKTVSISRIRNSYTYPCDFLLISACNPCPCGNYLNPFHECTCTPNQINRYLGKASSPLLDRFDLFAEVLPVDYEEIHSNLYVESSEEIRQRVLDAIEIQSQRYKNENFRYNALIPSGKIDRFCPLDKEASVFLKKAFDKYGFSLRSFHKVLRVGRTIADLDHSETISLLHISEAVSFRKPLKKYWR